MRDLLASNEPHAAEAVELFFYQIGKYLGALTAALGGIDALVFTAGIGEHAAAGPRAGLPAAPRGSACDSIATPTTRNGPRISTEDSPISVWVIPTNEERMIAMHTRDLSRPGAGRVTRRVRRSQQPT